jgi:hypothetical protein
MCVVAVIIDDLVAWLIALLGDAARKGLITLILGTELERALAGAAEAAVDRTVGELRPSGGESAEELARVIGQVFRVSEPGELGTAADETLLEVIGSGVAAQVAVLGDPAVTEQGVSSADLLGVPAALIAERLTANLTRQILRVGAGGGPLAALANQLNHDATHVAIRRAAGTLARLDDGVRAVLEIVSGRPETTTAADFADDLRALLQGLAWQADHGHLPPYLRDRPDLMALAREVRVQRGVRKGAVSAGGGGEGIPCRVYALAADRDERAEPPQPWARIAAAHDRVIVLADPGLGKSWLIRTETRRLARAALAIGGDLAGAVLPVPLRCDQLAAAAGLDLAARAADFLVGQGLLPERSRGLLAAKIRADEAIVLMDALDELTSGEAALVRSLVRSWAERAGARARCVITSRIAGYADPPLPDAVEVELQPFTPADVTAVICAWQLPPAAERQLTDRAADPAIAAMARVPLLLAMLCSLAGQPDGHDLPRTQDQLYERILRWFLTRAHRSADAPASPPLDDIEAGTLLDLLAPIAYTFATRPEGWTDLMPASDLINVIRVVGPAFTEFRRQAKDVLRDLATGAGIFVPDRDPTGGRSPSYLFLHRTFAEYLVARHLAALPEQQWLAIIDRHRWFDPDWVEVLRMLGERLAPAAARRLIEYLAASEADPFHHSLLLAAQIWGARPDADRLMSAESADELAGRLVELVRQPASRNAVIARLDASPYLPRLLLARLVTLVSDPNPRVREEVTSVMWYRGGPDVTEALLGLVSDPDREVRWAAVVALEEREGPDVTEALIDRISDPDPDLQFRAAEALADRREPDTTDALLGLLSGSGRDGRVRRLAAWALARRDGPDVTEALLGLVNDPDRDTRLEAVKALARRKGLDVTRALLGLVLTA